MAHSLATQTADNSEAARAGEITTQLASVTDAFSMYLRTLEESRAANQTGSGAPQTPRPLAEIADEERLLLDCRSALRRSMRELIATVEVDD